MSKLLRSPVKRHISVFQISLSIPDEPKIVTTDNNTAEATAAQ
jgi:hypothetical protein